MEDRERERVGTRLRIKVQGRPQIALMAEIRDIADGIQHRPYTEAKAQLLPDTKENNQHLPGLERRGRPPIISAGQGVVTRKRAAAEDISREGRICPEVGGKRVSNPTSATKRDRVARRGGGKTNSCWIFGRILRLGLWPHFLRNFAINFLLR